MDKKDANLKRLVRPTAVRTKSASSTPESTTEGNKNGSNVSSASPSTSDLVKKLSLNSAISPLNANRPGRLPSFRGERDLTLGGSRSSINSVTSVDGGGAKPKKEFKPTIPARRNKAQESLPVKEEKFAEPSNRGRGRRDGPTRGRGRGRPDLIQVILFLHSFFKPIVLQNLNLLNFYRQLVPSLEMEYLTLLQSLKVHHHMQIQKALVLLVHWQSLD